EARERSRGTLVDAVRLEEQVAGTRQRIQVLPGVAAPRSFAPLRVPAGQYRMLGDNRNDSADSRVIGLVPREKLIGRSERVL
ncbi:signal peptidase I, partial [Acinetobacter baumannii]|nr:signal peptidase I [Acinetobacter baumannii]